ncbi:MAG: GntR family transcriptional regulator [Alphaproteobacteria bacterium]|nr:MAG: GntR family transcriptional regulator [Alphaproteobacteria bacterium]
MSGAAGRLAPGRQTAAEAAYRRLRQDILTGQLPAGRRLTEAGLAESLGISRTPVREALKRLALEGLVEREAGQGARVASFPEDELEQIFQLRLMLEAYAARRAARFATPEEIAAMRALADEISACTPPRDEAAARRWSEANAAFHRAVTQAARSGRLAAMLALVVDVAIVMRTFRRYAPRDLIRSAAHHHEIVDAIAARAPDWAASVMTSHLLAAAIAAKGTPAPR